METKLTERKQLRKVLAQLPYVRQSYNYNLKNFNVWNDNRGRAQDNNIVRARGALGLVDILYP